ncbi:hypothetical protein QBC40DRAFT_287022 [Triangularia verruculosa]|uniref:Uncharacterized protein n=1 Tax=Triangularia verruculosa TaxID=2587418 RepID=A0AAN7AS64_9PEZI|nr:hypothetical protein QBC40DRAFT_287022 [Triangularia verruculosa]
MSGQDYEAPSGAFSQRDDATAGSGAMIYRCGDCAVRVPLEKGAPIRCQKCGARVLYKERTKRMVQFEAR